MPPEALAGQPEDNGELVFAAPWQARTFAMAVQLCDAGLFDWKEWSAALAHNIAEHEKHHAITDADAYYELWQATLEQIVQEKM